MVFQRADLFQRIIANIRAKKRLPNDVTPVPKARHLSNSKPHLLGSAVAPTASGGDGALQAATRQQQAVGTGGRDAASQESRRQALRRGRASQAVVGAVVNSIVSQCEGAGHRFAMQRVISKVGVT
ncbi:hypothetical protein PF001_g31867 [Phytophthora fragariae]|uniref:Uncharacterized protein n=1 Tax=Phytophthora fragariae TaxID=53985 RepID=A0A6A4AXN2_9STRA|nr:hypothetical protein PF009_g17477 [Phytophthora fragariae]KAE9092331.1 hypothetical protein PF006_g24729 [Phytophthora fragariae]KAE9262953.1 hypothetical protein PF001_g31867 [Phytophthora fragariae]